MPYNYVKVDDLKGTRVVGSRQCVALVQLYAGAPVTALWKQGDAVVGDAMLRKGTAIATFVNGRYPNHKHGNHAALFVRQGVGGIFIMDQWKGPKKTTVSARFIPSRGKDKNGNFIRPSENADAFFVIN